jgi:hypothetical protein
MLVELRSDFRDQSLLQSSRTLRQKVSIFLVILVLMQVFVVSSLVFPKMRVVPIVKTILFAAPDSLTRNCPDIISR